MQATMTRSTWRWNARLRDVNGLGGALAGLLSGGALLLLGPLIAHLHGSSAWAPTKGVTALVLGAGARAQPGFHVLSVLLGALMLLVGATVLGSVFGLVYRRVLHLTTDFGLPLYAGVAYGLVLFAVAWFGVLPAIEPELSASSATMAPILALTLVYAVGLGLFYTILHPVPYRVGMQAPE